MTFFWVQPATFNNQYLNLQHAVEPVPSDCRQGASKQRILDEVPFSLSNPEFASNGCTVLLHFAALFDCLQMVRSFRVIRLFVHRK